MVTSATPDIDLGSEMTFNKFEFTQFAQRIGSYKIQYWDGSQWLDAYTGGKRTQGIRILRMQAIIPQRPLPSLP
ncbi:hypothetical protein BK138_32425 [Paenibacillus rhizosphaerae]|uniref:F5/8 type C domain-containing protein n=1 Tax=Paenibacillus rhizosphaerae TaxID=297318 RepID=A0A1R1E5B9_9BACL|nr:hypothetical protein BK138_32425 [Paenibacillus rhizosphaerae]